ncbi:MAG: site-specific integrase [Terracidiphilus sp.]
MATRITKLPIGISEKVPGSGIYWIRYTVEGKKRREKVGTLSAAKDRLGVRHVQAKAGTLPNSSEQRPQKVTFAELVDDANKHLVSERTAAHAYDTGLKFNRMLPAFGKREAESITRQEVLDWLDEQAEEHEWSDTTRNRYVAAFSLIYSVASPDGTKKLTIKPWGRITRRQEDNSRVRFLSQEEEAAISKQLLERYPDYLNVFILALHTGARTSEVLRGQVGDYNSQTSMIKIHQTKDSRKPKVRFVPMTPMAVAAYGAMAADKEKGAPLCTNRSGKPLYEMRYWFLRALEASGVKDFTFHDVRHTAASRWVMSGVPLAAVAKYLGHSGAGMVMRYAHLQPEVNAKAINAAMSFYPASIQADTKRTPKRTPAKVRLAKRA